MPDRNLRETAYVLMPRREDTLARRLRTCCKALLNVCRRLLVMLVSAAIVLLLSFIVSLVMGRNLCPHAYIIAHKHYKSYYDKKAILLVTTQLAALCTDGRGFGGM